MERVRPRLCTISGVRRVTPNGMIGSLTIEYSSGTDMAEVVRAFGEHGIALDVTSVKRLDRGTQPTPSGGWRDLLVAGAAAHLVFDLLMLVIGVAAVVR